MRGRREGEGIGSECPCYLSLPCHSLSVCALHLSLLSSFLLLATFPTLTVSPALFALFSPFPLTPRIQTEDRRHDVQDW